MELCERVLERGVFAQGIRPPTVPEGSSRLRFTVMATHRAGELRAGRASWSAAPPASSADRRARRCSRSPQLGRTRVAAARRLRHRHRHRGRQDRRRRRHRPHPRPPRASASPSSSPRSPASTNPAEGESDRRTRPSRWPTMSCCGWRRVEQSDEEIAPYRYGPPASPHLAAALAGEEIEPGAAARGRPRRGGRRRHPGLRGRRRPAGAALRPASLPGPRPRGRPRASRW